MVINSNEKRYIDISSNLRNKHNYQLPEAEGRYGPTAQLQGPLVTSLSPYRGLRPLRICTLPLASISGCSSIMRTLRQRGYVAAIILPAARARCGERVGNDDL